MKTVKAGNLGKNRKENPIKITISDWDERSISNALYTGGSSTL